MEKITTDISTFENLRKGGYTYVDKTDLLWRVSREIVGLKTTSLQWYLHNHY